MYTSAYVVTQPPETKFVSLYWAWKLSDRREWVHLHADGCVGRQARARLLHPRVSRGMTNFCFHLRRPRSRMPAECNSCRQLAAADMPAIVAKTAQTNMPALTLDTFKGNFSVTSLIDKITIPLLEQQNQPQTSGSGRGLKPETSLHSSMQATQQLSDQFQG